MSTSDAAQNESWLQTIDRVLRGGIPVGPSTAPPSAALARRLVALLIALGAVAGVCLGSYQLFHGDDRIALRLVATACKVPMVLVLTAAVTLPSLYVFAALQRLELTLRALAEMLLVSSLVHVAVLASLGPVFAFFAASTDSYAFLLLLNVAFWAIAGVTGLAALRRVTAGSEPTTRRVIDMWCFVYGIVGAQMGWLLRPLLGRPGEDFAWFVKPEDNVFVGILEALRELFSA